MIVVSAAAGDQARPGGGRGAGFDHVIALDRQHAVRILPDDVPFVPTRSNQRATTLARVDVLAKLRQLKCRVSQFEEVSR